jgi:perosamine synthetase
LIPYAKHHLEEEDVEEVVRVLRSKSITQGEIIEAFEDEFKRSVGSKYAVAVSSGTAALHMALMAAGIGPGDEVIVPSMTFVATANAVRYMNASPIFADVSEKTLLIDPEDVERKITDRTKAIIPVDFAGQPADYSELKEIAEKHGLKIIADACHSLGATYKDQKVGTLADLNCFSLHASKLITSGEGGVITTDNLHTYARMKAFRNHGRVFGDMVFLGYNYRMSDIHAGLCLNQIKRIPELVWERQKLAEVYDEAIDDMNLGRIIQKRDRTNARHIYIIATKHRDKYIEKLLEYRVKTQIHYRPVTLQSFYNLPGQTPVAERMWQYLLTIPLFPGLTDAEQKVVIAALREVGEEVENG